MRLTQKQRHVLEMLQRAGGPIGAYALLAQLRAMGFNAPTQVYRALDKLAEHGLVHHLKSLNAYVSSSTSEHSTPGLCAFAICDTCGHIDELNVGDISGNLERWITKHAFSLGSTLEIRGTCDACASGASTGRK